MQRFLDECDYLIHLVRCTIHDLQPRELPDGMKFEYVYEWGKFHHIANLAFYSVEKLTNKPQEQLYQKWRRCRDQAIVRDINQTYAAQELREALRDAGVRTLEVQGTRIKPLYRQSDWRTMSDIDFIIDPENLPKATEVLEALGYECKAADRMALDAHRHPNINIELHTEFFQEDSPYRRAMSCPFAWVDDRGECELNGFYLYNILHIAKHYFYSGCGIRRVLDVYHLNQTYGPSLDKDRVREGLKLANAVEFAADLDRLAQLWFGLEEQTCPRSDLERSIIRVGLHGICTNILEHHVEKKFHNQGRFAKTRYYLRRFLGLGGELRNRYPILERHKILYPFCWLWRAVSSLHPRHLKRIRKEVRIVKKIDQKTQDSV